MHPAVGDGVIHLGAIPLAGQELVTRYPALEVLEGMSSIKLTIRAFIGAHNPACICLDCHLASQIEIVPGKC